MPSVLCTLRLCHQFQVLVAITYIFSLAHIKGERACKDHGHIFQFWGPLSRPPPTQIIWGSLQGAQQEAVRVGKDSKATLKGISRAHMLSVASGSFPAQIRSLGPAQTLVVVSHQVP